MNFETHGTTVRHASVGQRIQSIDCVARENGLHGDNAKRKGNRAEPDETRGLRGGGEMTQEQKQHTCKDCVFTDACHMWAEDDDADIYANTHGCERYSTKSEWVHLTCKLGDAVFVPWDWDGEQGVAVANIEEIQIVDSQNRWMFFIDLQSDDESFNQEFGRWKLGESIGETVFLTREKAEKALAERRGK